MFDFTNGFHDVADMVATAIASRAMKPAVAIAIVSGFTFIAPFTVGLAVADTVGTRIQALAGLIRRRAEGACKKDGCVD